MEFTFCNRFWSLITVVLVIAFFVLFVVISLEAAASENLSQEAIIENLDPAEAARLSKVRNIGIAVRGIDHDPDYETTFSRV